jgi:tetratricopeptide (TPR) repeat protein
MKLLAELFQGKKFRPVFQGASMHRFRMISSCMLAIFAWPLICLAQPQQPTGTAPLPRNASSEISAHELRIPSKARKSFNKGTTLLAEKKSEASIAEFQRAIQAFPDFYEAYYKIGVAELNLQHFGEAQAVFEKSIEVSRGRYPPADFGLGVALSLQQQFADAESAMRRGLDLDPGEAEGYFTLAWVLLKAEHVADAEKSARQAVLLRTDFADAYLLLAQIHLRQGNTSELVSDLDAYIKIDPNGPHNAEAIGVRNQAQQLLAKQRSAVPVVAGTPEH